MLYQLSVVNPVEYSSTCNEVRHPYPYILYTVLEDEGEKKKNSVSAKAHNLINWAVAMSWLGFSSQRSLWTYQAHFCPSHKNL